jgi:hypothetical protein
MTPGRDYKAYGEWLERKPKHPDLCAETPVRLMPHELGGGAITGRILWEDGSHHSYAVFVPYGEDGALIYVHKADVDLLEPEVEPDPSM